MLWPWVLRLVVDTLLRKLGNYISGEGRKAPDGRPGRRIRSRHGRAAAARILAGILAEAARRGGHAAAPGHPSVRHEGPAAAYPAGRRDRGGRRLSLPADRRRATALFQVQPVGQTDERGSAALRRRHDTPHHRDLWRSGAPPGPAA